MVAPVSSNLVDLDALINHLARLDHGAAMAVVDRARADGASVEAVITGLLAPALVELGRRWAAGEVGAAEALAAAAIARAAIPRPVVPPSHEGRPGVAVCCPPGEHHEIPAEMVTELLRAEGVPVLHIGAGVTPKHLPRFLSRHTPAALLVSCTSPCGLPGTARLIEVAHAYKVPVIVGGLAFGRDPMLALRLGAAAWAPSARHAIGIVESWLARPVPLPSGRELSEEYLMYEAGLPEIRAGVVQSLRRIADGGDDPDGVADAEDRLELLLRHLGAALLVDDGRLFLDFLSWRAEYYTHRNIGPDRLGNVLAAVSEALPPQFGRARRFVDEGRQHVSWLVRSGSAEMDWGVGRFSPADDLPSRPVDSPSGPLSSAAPPSESLPLERGPELRAPASLSPNTAPLNAPPANALASNPAPLNAPPANALASNPAPLNAPPANAAPANALASNPAPHVLAPYVLAPDVPAPYVPAPDVLAPDVLAPYVPAPYVPAPDVLAPDVLAPYVPAPDVPAPHVPAPYVPAPHVLAPHVLAPCVPALNAVPPVVPPDVVLPGRSPASAPSPPAVAPTRPAGSLPLGRIAAPGLVRSTPVAGPPAAPVGPLPAPPLPADGARVTPLTQAPGSPPPGQTAPSVAQDQRGRVFADLLFVAATTCHAPFALISVAQGDGKWSTLGHGVERRDLLADDRLLAAVGRSLEPLQISDLSKHPDLGAGPLARGPLGVRFVYGIPLRNRQSTLLGVLCILDRRPRELSARERQALSAVARQVAGQLAMWRRDGAAASAPVSTARPAPATPLTVVDATAMGLGSALSAAPPAVAAVPAATSPAPQPALRSTSERLGLHVHRDGGDELLRSHEVAVLFDVTDRTVINWAAANKLPSIRTAGGHLRFRGEDVLALLAGRPLSGPRTA